MWLSTDGCASVIGVLYICFHVSGNRLAGIVKSVYKWSSNSAYVRFTYGVIEVDAFHILSYRSE